MATIVVIDDETDVRDIIANILSIGGHHVLLAESGPALLEDLGRMQFDLVITDIRMSAVDGWKVAEWVRANRPPVPVIALSGVVEMLREYERNLVFNNLIPKPVRKAELLRQIERALGSAAAALRPPTDPKAEPRAD
ncbi:MAG: response regulator [Alphaproteobacteria bacterium]|nr:response regulator [Alphaproteobacteria bacterium]